MALGAARMGDDAIDPAGVPSVCSGTSKRRARNGAA
jgi:hypothetical protein